jgi:hypothetical protein
MLTQEIKKIHQKSKGTYGAPRIHAELAEQGWHVGRKRVARLMQAADLRGVSRRKAPRTTQRRPGAQPAPDLVQRNFTASRPNELWVADITYIPTWAGFLYLAVVVDAWSRRVVGWALATHLRTELVLQALQTPALRAGAVWLASSAIPRMSSTIPIIIIPEAKRSGMAASTRPLPLVAAAAKPASAPRWARSAIALIMPCVKASSPLSSVNCLTAPASTPRLKRTQLFFSSSKAGTIRIVVTQRSTISHPTGTKPCMLVPHDPQVATCPRKRGNSRTAGYQGAGKEKQTICAILYRYLFSVRGEKVALSRTAGVGRGSQGLEWNVGDRSREHWRGWNEPQRRPGCGCSRWSCG